LKEKKTNKEKTVMKLKKMKKFENGLKKERRREKSGTGG